ncbi:MAG: hypothetical protein AAGI66_05210 [Cyanobacteria bacterium P01_H01_bin.74]
MKDLHSIAVEADDTIAAVLNKMAEETCKTDPGGLNALTQITTAAVFEQDEKRYKVYNTDLNKMEAMQLGDLPVQAIALPETAVFFERLAGCKTSQESQLSGKLTDYFPVYFVAALYELQSFALRFNASAYVIGGLTRDVLRFNEKYTNQVGDIDITIEGDAIGFGKQLSENSRNFTLAETYPDFGTAKVRYKESLVFDLASTREEIYSACGAMPTIISCGIPLKQDITRRDFTVNAIALSIHALGTVVDYSQGIADIKDKVMRVLHPVSFFEDPSRILRAMKFATRFQFDLSTETRHLIRQFMRYGDLHYRGGGERIKDELKEFFLADESTVKSHWVGFFLETGCDRLVNMDRCTEVSKTQKAAIGQRFSDQSAALMTQHRQHIRAVEAQLTKYSDPDFLFLLYLCFYFRDFSDALFEACLSRLGLTRAQRDTIVQYRNHHEALLAHFPVLVDHASAVDIYELFKGLRLVTVAACLIEYRIQAPACAEKIIEAFILFKRKWEGIALELDGKDLLELGVPQGKQIGECLTVLLHAKLMGRVRNRMDEIQFMQKKLESTKQADNANKPAQEKNSNNSGKVGVNDVL